MAQGMPFSGGSPGGECSEGGGCDNGGTCYPGGGSGLPSDRCFAPWFRTGTCSCLSGDQRVSLANGSTKLAAEVTKGDQLLGLTQGGEPQSQIVSSVGSGFEICLEINHENGSLVCSETHVIFTVEQGPITVSSLCVDEHTLLADNLTGLRITSIRHLDSLAVYHWTCEPDHTFVAEGIVHHNKPIYTIPPGALTL